MASFNKRNKFLRENALLGISRGGGLAQLTRLRGGPGLANDLIMRFSCPSESTERPVMEAEPRSARSLEFQPHDTGLKEPLVLAGSAMVAQPTRW